MPNIVYKPERIYINNDIIQNPLTQRIIQRFPAVPIKYFDDFQEIQDIAEEVFSDADNIGRGKRNLVITPQKGRFLKNCPGTQNYLCCLYYILNIANNCDLDCTYCILQSYFNNPMLIVYANVNRLLDELSEVFSQNPHKLYRIGTGELADSLSLDYLTEFSKTLVPFFSRLDNAILELKTKTVYIDNLLNLNHNRRTVVSWSLNSETVTRSEELKSASLDERLQAALECQRKGYLLGFHFDPLIYYPGWEKDYRAVVNKLFSRIDPKGIVWISMGCLRFMPQLKPIIQKRFPQSQIVYGEFFPGLDGKMRYLKYIRIEMFTKMLSWIREHSPDTCVYLCMESSEIWQKAFGWSPKDNEDLSGLLDRSVFCRQ